MLHVTRRYRYRQQVFERFYRIQDSSGDGCGLGLAIVKEIVALHGAAIRVEEPAGGGIRFALVFPIPSACAATTSLLSGRSALQSASSK
jgi:signal transduction histidine kinase